MKKTKQFKDFLNEDLFLDLIDVESQAQVVDHFYDRYVTNDDKFVHYFNSNIKRIADQYYDMERIESIQFDPMVTRYLEQEDTKRRQRTNTINDSITDRGMGSTTIEDTATVKTDNETTDSLSSRFQGEQSGSFSTRTETDIDEQTANSDEVRTRDLISNTPHSNVSSSTSMDLMSPITWNYASGLTDHGEDGTHTSHKTGDDVVAETGSNSDEQDNTTTQSGTTVLDGTQLTTRTAGTTANTTNTRTGLKEGEDNENETLRKIYTGREGIAADLLDKARKYLRQSRAIEWLFDELEICFMQDLLYGEEN